METSDKMRLRYNRAEQIALLERMGRIPMPLKPFFNGINRWNSPNEETHGAGVGFFRIGLQSDNNSAPYSRTIAHCPIISLPFLIPCPVI